MDNTYNSIVVTTDGPIQEIMLNRPETINALTNEMLTELHHALGQAERNSAVRVVILAGSGRGFCSGQNLKEVAGRDESVDIGEHVARYYNPLIMRLYHLNKPTICRIQGACAGAGMSLAMACDFRIGSPQAKFSQAFVKIGLVPDSGSTYFLPRLVGMAKALELALLGDVIDASSALQWGILSKMTEADHLEADTKALADRLAAMPPVAVGMIKRALHRGTDASLSDQLLFELHLQRAAAATEDHHIGVQAFLNKETPRFVGR
ncbi:MAG: enoyl-CoA hydratase [Sulfobacillus thermosulfidooxidans]|nr:MAG: enoyl-CoA hydratase [Sulfobacillus thermosulfidooxidans]